LTSLLLAMLALVSQLALGSIVLPDDAAAGPVVALDELTVLCSPGNPPRGDHKKAPRHTTDEALCPARVAVALLGVVLASAPALPTPSSHATGRAYAQPHVRGPPSPASQAALPRGPPLPT
jgi:hypothetical protein